MVHVRRSWLSVYKTSKSFRAHHGQTSPHQDRATAPALGIAAAVPPRGGRETRSITLVEGRIVQRTLPSY
jgi:hypothetical protein